MAPAASALKGRLLRYAYRSATACGPLCAKPSTGATVAAYATPATTRAGERRARQKRTPAAATTTMSATVHAAGGRSGSSVHQRQSRRPERLPRIEAETVRRLEHARARSPLCERDHRVGRRALRRPRDGAGHDAGDGERHLLRPCAPLERIPVERDERHEERHAPRLAEEREDEEADRGGVPAARAEPGPAGVGARKIREQGEEPEDAADRVAPFRDPHDGLDAQRVKRPEERGCHGGDAPVKERSVASGRHARQQREKDGVERQRARGVPGEAVGVVHERPQAGERIVHPQRHPRERLVVPHVGRGPDPRQAIGPGELEVRIAHHETVVVVVDEAGGERGEEGRAREEGDARAEHPAAARGRRRLGLSRSCSAL